MSKIAKSFNEKQSLKRKDSPCFLTEKRLADFASVRRLKKKTYCG